MTTCAPRASESDAPVTEPADDFAPAIQTRQTAAQRKTGDENGMADWMGQPGSCAGGASALPALCRQCKWLCGGGSGAAPTSSLISPRRAAAPALNAGLGLTELRRRDNPGRLSRITDTKANLDKAIAPDTRTHSQRHAGVDDLEMGHFDTLTATRNLAPSCQSSGAELGAARASADGTMTTGA